MKRGYISNLIPMFIGIIIMSVLSCKPSVPSEYIQPDEMEDILYDYYVSQAMAYQYSDSKSPLYNKNLYYYAVLKKHGVTEAEFDSSLVYYYTYAEQLNKIYKNLSDRLEKEAVSLGASSNEIGRYSALKADGDTANVWRDATALVLMPVPPYNRMDFTIESDSTFKRGDSFMMNFMTTFVYQSGTKDAVIYIAMRYDNDSISTHTTRVSSSGLTQFRIPANTNNDIKEIKGFVYLNRGSDESGTLKLMFIDNIQMIRFHQVKPMESAENVMLMKRDTVKTIGKDSLSRDTVKLIPPMSKGMMKHRQQRKRLQE